VVHVVEADGGQRRVEGASQGHVVGHEKERVELLEAPELGDGAGRAGVPSRRHVDPAHGGQRIAQIRRRPCPELFAGDHRDHGRDGVDLFMQALRGDLDVLGARRRVGRW